MKSTATLMGILALALIASSASAADDPKSVQGIKRAEVSTSADKATGTATGKRNHRTIIRTATRTRTKTYETANQSLSTPMSTRWECTNHNNEFTTCECEGVLDCKNLFASGECEGKTAWEDANDPSIGGCDG